MALSLEQMLAVPKPETLAVPEWGGEVLVKVLTADEKAAWEKSCQVQKRGPKGEITIVPNDKVNVRASLVAIGLVNEQGQPVLTADQAGKAHAGAIERVFVKLCALNGIGEKDAAELEGEEKNS